MKRAGCGWARRAAICGACVGIAAGALGGPVGTHAQDAPAASEAPSSQAASSADPGTTGEVEARALYTAAQAAYHEGRFENALLYFQRAYDLTRRPALLYNLGITYDRLRRDEEALASFEQYLREDPQADNAREVEGRIEILRTAIERTRVRDTPADPPPADPSVDPPPSDPPPTASPGTTTTVTSDPGPGPWIVVGAGGAAVIVGAILLGVAAADVASVEGAAPGTEWSSVRAAYERSEAESIAGAVLIGVGAAAAAAGVVWAVAGTGETRTTVAPTAGGLVVRGAF